jgi:hypothetical protein
MYSNKPAKKEAVKSSAPPQIPNIELKAEIPELKDFEEPKR